MKRIRKTHPPKAFTKWLDENKSLNCGYDVLKGTEAHTALKKQLIKEQGYLCAYTGLEIHEDTSHVEHLKPQDKCAENEDVDYRNLVACFPHNGGDKSYGYGAPVKGNWWDEKLFVSPLSEDCERRFKIPWSGKIKPNSAKDPAAKKTIEILGLNHDNLVRLRRGAIHAFFGYGAKSKQLSKNEALRLLRTIDKCDASGKLRPFCFALKPLLERYVKSKGNA